MRNFIYIILILLSWTSNSQSWQWGKRGGSTNVLYTEGYDRRPEEVYSIVTDSQKNIYILSAVGLDNLNIDGHPKTNFGDVTTLTDFAIASFACDGTYRWSKIIGGAAVETVQKLQIDSNDNIYVSGKIGECGHIFYPPRIDDDIIINQSPPDCSLLFITKFNSDGEMQWYKRPQSVTVSQADGSALSYSRGLATDTLGNCYWLVAIPPGVYVEGSFTNTQEGSNWFIFKYNADGQFVMAMPLDLHMRSGGLDINFTRNHLNGNFYITGQKYTNYEISIGGAPVTHSAYMASFGPTGEFLWKRENSATLDGSFTFDSLLFDGENNIFLSARMAGLSLDTFFGLTIPEPIITTVLMKLTPEADEIIWHTYYPHNGAGHGAIAFNGDEIGFASYCYGANFTWGNQSLFAANPNQGKEVLLARFNKADGVCIGLVKIPGDIGYDDEGKSLAVDASGDYILGGNFGHYLDFDNNVRLVSVGPQTDFFVAKYSTSACSPLAVEEQLQKTLEIYPNPATHNITLSIVENSVYKIFSITGQEVSSGFVNTPNNTIEVSPLASGCYILQTTNENGAIKTVKLFKS